MKKKWIIPAIIAAVLVVIVSLIAFFPAMLLNGMAKEQVKRLDNSFLLTLINDVQFSSKATHSTAMRYQSMLLQLPTLIDRATKRMENRLRYYL